MIYVYKQIWNKIEGWSDYEISNYGQVKRERILRPYDTGNGYLIIGLRKSGAKRKQARVHRLVLEAFWGPCPEGMEGCHKNGKRWENDIWNLRWDTHEGNLADMKEKPDQSGGENPGAKLKKAEVIEMRRLQRNGVKMTLIAKMFKTSYSSGRRAIKGESWKNVA